MAGVNELDRMVLPSLQSAREQLGTFVDQMSHVSTRFDRMEEAADVLKLRLEYEEAARRLVRAATAAQIAAEALRVLSVKMTSDVPRLLHERERFMRARLGKEAPPYLRP